MSTSAPRRPQALALLLAGSFLAVAAAPPGAVASESTPSLEAAPKAYRPHAAICVGYGQSLAARAAAEGWPGNGSPSNPYVISGYEITTGCSLGHAIYISYQTAWVVIKDNWVHDAPRGIRLQYGANAIVTGNVIEGLTLPFLGGIYSSNNNDVRINGNVIRAAAAETGITVWDYGPSMVADNTITGGRFGINAWSYDQVITRNTVRDSTVFGIWDRGAPSSITDNDVRNVGRSCIVSQAYSGEVLRNALDGCTEAGLWAPGGGGRDGPTTFGENTITSSPVAVRVTDKDIIVRGNTARDAGSAGVLLDGKQPVTVTANVLENRTTGIQVVGGRDHLITGNLVKGGADGLRLQGSIFNTITGNRVTGNERGITLNASEGNLIYDNLFANGHNALVVNGSDNEWSIAVTPGTNIVGGPFLGGNSWSDYTGVDADLDGLGEVPYGLLPAGVFPAIPPEAPPWAPVPATPVPPPEVPPLPEPPVPAPAPPPQPEDTYAGLMPYGPYDKHPLMTAPVAVAPPEV